MVTFWDLDGDELREGKEVSDCRIPSVASENFEIFEKLELESKLEF